jgi:hypothetical protein
MFMTGFGSSGQHVGGEIGAILGAGVGGMDAEGVETAARVLPDAAPLIPVEAQSPKQLGQSRFASGRNVQPNPLADNLGDFVCPGNRVRKKFKTASVDRPRLTWCFETDDGRTFAGADASI